MDKRTRFLIKIGQIPAPKVETKLQPKSKKKEEQNGDHAE